MLRPLSTKSLSPRRHKASASAAKSVGTVATDGTAGAAIACAAGEALVGVGPFDAAAARVGVAGEAGTDET